ncbi:IS3 family transposase [Luteibacter aegosomatissinici]|uniref:IS3 family transposase n=1 Tax=Luteibacter aegosomatissinici TaxID=2911539 RepID=UPI001FF8C79B|nr:IS3 family transposase [Luteibacter aegosomatissinici]UPG93814.1 IS3 family transposase [Luteibacter aegosomatissinici]UPG95644.1 IS3 family transposase [Luteibacter aegosomatissinici]UPG96399.1 IS3 family transposase [Luteibacter aegosomatissinici]
MRGTLSIRRTLAILGWPRSSFYAKPRPPAPVSHALAKAARRIHRASRGHLGARMMSKHLREKGFDLGREKAATLMRRLDLPRRKRRFKHYARNTKPAPAGNVLAQQFDPAHANVVWAGDITFIPTRQGWLYLAIVVDLFSRRIIGWATSTVADTRLALEASHLAFASREPAPGLIFHTDQGCQYTSDAFVSHLAARGTIQSMSRKGNCWDNAVVERIFRSLKHEWLEEDVLSRDEVRADVIDFVARYYNHERLHSTLDYLPPAEFERRAAIRS